MAKIFLDAGHNYSGGDTGAVGNGLREQDVTYEIAKAVGRLLSAHSVKYSRENLKDNLGSGNVSSSLAARYTMANEWGAELFVSVHCNAGGGTGFETYYDENNAGSKEFAEAVNSSYGVSNSNLTDRGVKTATFAVISASNINCSAILIEVAFIDNKNDADYLKNQATNNIAAGIANGITAYLSGNPVLTRRVASNFAKKYTAEQLEQHFKGTGLEGLGEYFIEYGDLYDVNPMLLASIAVHESDWGNSDLAKNNNNLFGRMTNGGSQAMSFSSKEECIKNTANHLAANYLGEGLTTVESIGAKYCPIGANNDPNNLNQYWIPNVTKYYEQFSGESISTANLGSGSGNGSGSSLSKTHTTKSFRTNSETDWLLEPTEDERKYGINIYDGEQPLIKFSTAAAVSKNGNAVGALKKYSEFLYYLLNSEVTTAQANCIGMPWIRPGFNVWYDPIYSDTVYYCTNVQHQGDPENGGTTTLTLVLGRSREAFINDADRMGSLKDHSDNVFISDMKEEYRVSKFGKCLDSSEAFESVKNATMNYYGSPSFETVDAADSEFHRQMYVAGADSSPIPENVDKDKIFSGAYTKEQIESQLASLYSKAPIVIKNRSDQLKKVVDSARKYMDKYHVLESHR